MGFFSGSSSNKSGKSHKSHKSKSSHHSHSRSSSRAPTFAPPPGMQYRIIDTYQTDRSRQRYSAEPEDIGAPAFTRTNSFYRTNTDEPEYDYLQASDVRRQVREAPERRDPRVSKYPAYYGNQPPLPLRARSPYQEYPIAPSPQYGSAPSNYVSGKPGPVRAFYNRDDRQRGFDVGFHDPAAPPAGPREGRAFPRSQYSLASYTPGPDYTDTVRYSYDQDRYGRQDDGRGRYVQDDGYGGDSYGGGYPGSGYGGYR